MSMPPFTYIPGYIPHHAPMYEIPCGNGSVGSDVWDDSDVNEAYELEKASGNIYVPEGEESLPPGSWIPVTPVSPQIHHLTWGPLPPPIPTPPLTLPPLIHVSNQNHNHRGKGKLFKTVFPPQQARKGKLYEAVLAQNGAGAEMTNGEDDDAESVGKEAEEKASAADGSMEDLVNAAYNAGYQDGYEAATRGIPYHAAKS